MGMFVGSRDSSVRNGRRGLGVELKSAYYRQAVKNVAAALSSKEEQEALPLVEAIESSMDDPE